MAERTGLEPAEIFLKINKLLICKELFSPPIPGNPRISRRIGRCQDEYLMWRFLCRDWDADASTSIGKDVALNSRLWELATEVLAA